MADPLSISASLLAVITAAIQSSKSLYATVQRYKSRDKTLQRLLHEVDDLVNILTTLQEAISTEATILKLLQNPVERCSQVCRDLEAAMTKFSGKSNLGFIDWARLEFRASDINGFMDALAGYKSTIMVGVGAINMQTSKINQKVLEDYNEMIQDTAYNLTIQLQRIDDKLEHLTEDSKVAPDTTIDLQNEKDVTEQCLQICENAMACYDALKKEKPALLGTDTSPFADNAKSQFEAQLQTNQMINDNRDKILETSRSLQERLSQLMSSSGPDHEQQRSQLQADLATYRECLEVCDQVSKQVSYQKIHTIGEIIADDDTDQVVVTTLADLFDVRRVVAKNRSAQLVGSMSDASLRQLSTTRYSSRFGAPSGISDNVLVDVTDPLITSERRGSGTQPVSQTRTARQPTDARSTAGRPSPNEMRKRTGESESTK